VQGYRLGEYKNSNFALHKLFTNPFVSRQMCLLAVLSTYLRLSCHCAVERTESGIHHEHSSEYYGTCPRRWPHTSIVKRLFPLLSSCSSYSPPSSAAGSAPSPPWPYLYIFWLWYNCQMCALGKFFNSLSLDFFIWKRKFMILTIALMTKFNKHINRRFDIWSFIKR
jgi:hypothetical protein